MGAHEQPAVPGALAHGWVYAPAPPPVPRPSPGEHGREAEAGPAAYLPTRCPAEPVGFTTAPPHHPRPQWDQPRAQRLRGSHVAFGLVGCLVVTGLVVLFVLWMLNAGPFALFLVPAVPALVWFLKDNWRKAPEPTHMGVGPRVVARDLFTPPASDDVLDPHVRPPDATTP